MKRIVLITVLVFGSLFSANIAGNWQMDMAKMQKTNPMEKMKESKQLAIGLFANAWTQVKFAPNGTFLLPKAKQNGIWKKSKKGYSIQASAKAPENRLTILDAKHMKIVFHDPNLGIFVFYFLKQER